MNRRKAARPRHSWRGRFMGATLWLLSVSAYAAGFEVSPTRSHVLAPDRVADFELLNSSAEPVTVQIDVYAWQQDRHEERLTAANGLMVMPRIASIAPGGGQLVRIALTEPTTLPESAFRVHFREVPPPLPAGFVGVRTTVKMDVPVFFQTDPLAQPALDWRVVRSPAGQLVLLGRNHGTRHAAFNGARVTTPEGTLLADMSGPRYVLPATEREWPLRTLTLPEAESTVRLVLRSGNDEQALDRTVD